MPYYSLLFCSVFLTSGIVDGIISTYLADNFIHFGIETGIDFLSDWLLCGILALMAEFIILFIALTTDGIC